MESLPLSLQENCSPWLGFPLPAAWFPCGHLNGQGGLGVRGQRRWGLGTPFHRGLRRVGAGLWWVPRWAGCESTVMAPHFCLEIITLHSRALLSWKIKKSKIPVTSDFRDPSIVTFKV